MYRENSSSLARHSLSVEMGNSGAASVHSLTLGGSVFILSLSITQGEVQTKSIGLHLSLTMASSCNTRTGSSIASG